MAHRIILTAFQPDEELAQELATRLAAACEREGAMLANLEVDGPVPDDEFARIAEQVGAQQ